MNIELDDDTVERIFRQGLIEEIKFYREELADVGIIDFINAPPYRAEDISTDCNILKALEILAPYYLGMNWEDKVNGTVSS